MQVNRPGHILNVHVAQDVAILRHLALDLRKGEVVAIAVGGYVAFNLVRGEVVMAAGEVDLHRTRDGAEVDVSLRGGDAYAGAETGNCDITTAIVDADVGRLGNCNGQ